MGNKEASRVVAFFGIVINDFVPAFEESIMTASTRAGIPERGSHACFTF